MVKNEIKMKKQKHIFWVYWGRIVFVVVLMSVTIGVTVWDGYSRRNDPDPIHYFSPHSFPGKWLGDKVTVNGKTLEITGYNSWKNHFNLSDGTILKYSHPSVPNKRKINK